MFQRLTVVLMSVLVSFSSALGSQEGVIEFRKGDRVPLSLMVGGDVVEFETTPQAFMLIKRDTWIKVDSSGEVLMSFDQKNFSPIRDLVTGVLSAGISESGVNLVLKIEKK